VTIGGDRFDDVSVCCKTQEDERQVIDISSDILDENPMYFMADDDDPFLNVSISSRCGGAYEHPILSPCQKQLKDQLRLPAMVKYPVPLHCSPDDPEEVRTSELFKAFERFVLELHKGIRMTQVNAHLEIAHVHCQLLDDLQTFKIDQGNGRIVEFPLTAVTKMYRDMKLDSRDRDVPGGGMPSMPLVCTERHIVVLEFMRRSLSLVFGTVVDAQSFMMCMDLLVHFARETVESAAPSDPQQASSEFTRNSDESSEQQMIRSI